MSTSSSTSAVSAPPVLAPVHAGVVRTVIAASATGTSEDVCEGIDAETDRATRAPCGWGHA